MHRAPCTVHRAAVGQVTTNYDSLYEDAVDSAANKTAAQKAADEGAVADDAIMRLPWDNNLVGIAVAGTRQVLKLHGCVSDPDSIVLTRGDYMRYADERVALRGCLHQSFLEREFLVIGFSMTDDNVHLIIDQVRKAMKGKKEDGFRMGTILALVENPMFRRLWDQDFDIVSCAERWEDNPAWTHDIFLDCMAAGIVINDAATSFVLNPSYDTLLSSAQEKIKAALASVHALASQADVKSSKSWYKIETLLKDFGAPEFNVKNEEEYE